MQHPLQTYKFYIFFEHEQPCVTWCQHNPNKVCSQPHINLHGDQTHMPTIKGKKHHSRVSHYFWHTWHHQFSGHMNPIGWHWRHWKPNTKMQFIWHSFCMNAMVLGYYLVHPPLAFNNACTMLGIDFTNLCTTSTSVLFHSSFNFFQSPWQWGGLHGIGHGNPLRSKGVR